MSTQKQIDTIKALSKWMAGSGSKYLPLEIPSADAKDALSAAIEAMRSEFSEEELVDMVGASSAMSAIIKDLIRSGRIVMFSEDVDARLSSLEKGVSRGRKTLRRICKKSKQ